MKTLVFSILLGSTALAPAFAQGANQDVQRQSQPQTTQTQAANDANACATLTVLMTRNNNLVVDVDRQQIQQWQEAQNNRACAEELTEIEQDNPEEVADARRNAATGQQRTQQQADLNAQSGRIVVDPAEPQITVDQPEPRVTVSDPEPQVDVNQAAPQIVVEQQQPTVRIQIPRPIVTIEQPRPNIRVQMPSPDVQVSDARPQVSVEQGQPEVSVQQGQPDVRLQQPDVAVQDTENAQVRVRGGEAVVQTEADQGEPEVNISKAEPQVTYQEAEPRVVLEDVPEPEVQYSETGEVQVEVEEQGQQQAAQGQQTQQQDRQVAAQQERDNPDAAQREQAAEEGTDVETTASASSAGATRMISVDELMDSPLIGAQGEAIGDVENVVLLDNQTYAVVGVGGFLSLGERQVAIPFENITFREDGFHLRNMTEDEVVNMPDYQEGQGQALGRGETREISTE